MADDTLTLIGFNGTMGEYYLKSGALYEYRHDSWISRLNACSGQHLYGEREKTLSKMCETTSLNQIPDTVRMLTQGLFHCVITDLIHIITSYYVAIMSCPWPVPRDDVYRLCDIDLTDFHVYQIDRIGERWRTSEDYFIYQSSTWWTMKNDNYRGVSPLRKAFLTTRRKQILGLPMRSA